jgi:hypothetical protein
VRFVVAWWLFACRAVFVVAVPAVPAVPAVLMRVVLLPVRGVAGLV